VYGFVSAYLLRTGDKRNDGEDPVLNRTWLKMREVGHHNRHQDSTGH